MKKLSKKKIKQRRKVGIAKAYISRAAAIRKLQVTLADFRRICILKGVYPVEPKNKSKLSGANTRRKTYYFTKDIQFLMHESLLEKFWDFKVFMKRLSKAKGRHDFEKFKRTLDNKPFYKLDSIVKERYPRFIDSLRDCDDALSMCSLFAMFPKGRNHPDDLIDISRRLTLEFMHYVIHSKSLRKVFISIKGYYYQAEIFGQTINWIVPHQFVIDRTSNVDINVMKTFTEFYITLLGFINYRLYQSINAVYPPQLVCDNIKDIKSSGKRKHEEVSDSDAENDDHQDKELLIAALNKDLKIASNKNVLETEQKDQQPDTFNEDEEDSDKSKLTPQQLLALENLFKDCKFFLNRECPRESLTFIIRAMGGLVSWDDRLFPGATYDESDETITHQIVDRSNIKQQYMNRIYVQPQWVYDSINMRMLLPTAEYLVGSVLPPHLSPFVNEKKGDYVPPDKIKLMNLRKQYEAENEAEKSGVNPESDLESEFEGETELEKPVKRQKIDKNKSTGRSKMLVKTGKLHIEDKEDAKKREDQEYRKMGIMMIPKKKKRLFNKITKTQKQRGQKTETMRAKRRIVDAVSRNRSSRRR